MIIEIQMTALVFMFALFFARPTCWAFPDWAEFSRLWIYRVCLLVFVFTTLGRIWL